MDAELAVSADYSTSWQYAYGGPLGQCLFKSRPEDFLVDELLPFEPEGDGEHLYLLVEKKGENTDWVACLLAHHARVRRQSVSYAGRKDRHGVTRQWFCITLPGLPDPDWSGLGSDSVRILDQVRHRKKLRTGVLKANDFCITLRAVQGDIASINARLERIAQGGVPNYYGEQRFGIQGQNVAKAVGMLDGKFRVQRNKRSLYLSAARSWLFNRVLSEKVGQGVWNQAISGDALGFQGSNSLVLSAPDEHTLARLERGELSPTSPLWGRGPTKVSACVDQLEQSIVSDYAQLSRGLEQAGLNKERRINRLVPERLNWSWQGDSEDPVLKLGFRLPKGCFATSVLRELLNTESVAQ